MTKAKARERAKARAAAKLANLVSKDEKPKAKQPAAHFDPKANTMRNTGGGSPNLKVTGMRRGSQRSR